MGKTSKDLLHFEHKKSSSSPIGSALLVCKKDPISKKPRPDEKPTTTSVPKSEVLGKVKDFLGVFSKANERLLLDAKDHSDNYDIEVLTGNESEVIEMDLMLGIADLHTPEAVSAAESALSGYQPVISLAGESSESESEEDIQDDDADGSTSDRGNENENHKRSYNNDERCSLVKNLKRSKPVKDNSSGKKLTNKGSKIIELS